VHLIKQKKRKKEKKTTTTATIFRLLLYTLFFFFFFFLFLVIETQPLKVSLTASFALAVIQTLTQIKEKSETSTLNSKTIFPLRLM